jgi:hypothetical protein
VVVEDGCVVVGEVVVGEVVVKPFVEVVELLPLVENGPKKGLPTHGTVGAGKSSQ